MTSTPPALRPLRVWPAMLLLVLLWALRLTVSYADPAALPRPVTMFWFMSPIALSVLILLWWVLLSRALVSERIVGFVGFLAIAAGTTYVADPSLFGAGSILFVLPVGISAFVLALVVLRRRARSSRTGIALLAALVAFGFWDLVRMDAVFGDMRADFSWRWEPSPEEAFLASLESREKTPAVETDPAAAVETDPAGAGPEWPGFRGPHRDGTRPGVVLAEDWSARPPVELWRVRVGPGWSSFAVAGARIYTQEQRGEDESVVCLDAKTGAELWQHRDTSRFWEAIGGAGPRATPTLAGGALYAFGAAGVLQRLDPQTGEESWQRDVNDDAAREPPTWGYASSPLVTDGVVIVYAGGADGKGLLAYDIANGEPRWSAPAGDQSYSSPQLAVVDGRRAALMLTNTGVVLVDPASGAVLGEHEWVFEGYRVVQPRVLGGSSVLLGTGVGEGTRRIDVRWDGDRFSTETRWTSRRMSPDFNDSVVHEGALYGFDKNIFACVDLETGERRWKRGRYGNGQALLLPDADQLLVLGETGEIVLLRAGPTRHEELARHPVLEGRTWAHPVLVDDRLYVRGGDEAACFRMPLGG